ncbi:IS110 family transposase [Orientia tsutsugamushi]|nr:IS110 family transposase [Orientia tsutsugamushi]
MPAMSALRHNCIIKQFSQRLSDTGKPKMLILIVSMRKLLHNSSVLFRLYNRLLSKLVKVVQNYC